ncbi:hypothetical protein G7046_g2665 [Stylonectria norvegica]|nr:hypothetical protein G7046_g2665 [Stylonectria norvegica]
MRRQNRSCDQCRKAKRACDAPSLWDIKRNPGRIRPEGDTGAAVSLAEEHIEDIDARALRCSYCLRTRKQCTFHWVRAQLQTGPAGDVDTPPGTNGSNVRRIPDPARPKAKRQRTRPQTGSTSALPASLQSQGLDVNTTALLDILQMPPTTHDLNSWGPMETAGFNNLPTFPTTTFDSMPTNGVFDPTAFDTGFHPSVLDTLEVNPGHPHASPLDLSPCSEITHHALQPQPNPTPEEENCETGWPIYHNHHAGSEVPFQPSPSANSYESDGSSLAHSMRAYPESLSRAYSSSISPFSATNAMVQTTNRNLISENLMRIYHDVLEHALSCWLSEETCPYDMKPSNMANGVTWLASDFEKLNILDHYEPTYQDNRIYRRVIKLDRVAQSTKLIKLTKSEDRAASKALHLAIMAFATQWAQGSQRERDRCQPTLAHTLDSARSDSDDMSDDFDRTLQRTFWAQAKRALQDCSDMECFRVVCADLIFGLAQKPMEEDDFGYDRGFIEPGSFNGESPIANGEGSIASKISEIISQEGPPVFMERAARKMHALKYQYEARETGVLDRSKSSLGLEKTSPTETMSAEDRGTIGLVYWMTVMFDTVSSSMNGRPVVVSDEECQHDAAYQEHLEEAQASGYQLHDTRWWAELFIRDNIEGVLRFPCNYDTAIKGVIAAAPVKVLLFRHVSYLQNIVRSRRRGETVEKVILNAMAVYRHWNITYAAFFRDLVDHYDMVPAHIQSWFVCIVAHFHLAALLLTDLIELVDDNNFGIEYATQVRLGANVVACLREDSSRVLSDLARVSTALRATDVPGSHLAEMHFAVSEGSILTEPWTMILIRGFTKSAIIHLTEVEDLVRQDPNVLRLETTRVINMVKRYWMDGSEKEKSIAAGIRETVKHTSRRKGAGQPMKPRASTARIAPKASVVPTKNAVPVPVSSPHDLPTMSSSDGTTPSNGTSPQSETATSGTTDTHTAETEQLMDGSISSLPSEDLILVMHYLDHVLPLQYPMYDLKVSEEGRGWLLHLILRTKPLYHAVSALSAYHRRETMFASIEHPRRAATLIQQETHLEMAIQAVTLAAQSACPRRGLSMVIAINQLMFFELFTGGDSSAWQAHLKAATTMCLRRFQEDLTGFGLSEEVRKILIEDCPYVAPVSGRDETSSVEVVSFRLLSGTMFWLDITAAITSGTAPALLEYHSKFISASSQIRLEVIMGCRNSTMLQTGRIAALHGDRCQALQQGTFDCAVFEKNAEGIRRDIEHELSLDVLECQSLSHCGIKADHKTHIMRIFTLMPAVYLHLVTYGYQSLHLLGTAVAAVVEILRHETPSSVLPVVVCPMFVVGSAASGLENEAFFRGLFSSESVLHPSLRHRRRMGVLLEQIWSGRRANPNFAWEDSLELMRNDGVLLV